MCVNINDNYGCVFVVGKNTIITRFMHDSYDATYQVSLEFEIATHVSVTSYLSN